MLNIVVLHMRYVTFARIHHLKDNLKVCSI